MVNKVILIGHLGADPKVSHTQGGTAVATLSVATNRRVKGKDGNFQDETEWHRVIVWDKAAEFCGNYLSKGAKVYIDGRLQTRKWKDQEGVERYTTEIVAHETKALSQASGSAGSRSDDSGAQGGMGEPSGGDHEFGDVPF